MTRPDGSTSQWQTSGLCGTQSHDGCAQVVLNWEHDAAPFQTVQYWVGKHEAADAPQRRGGEAQSFVGAALGETRAATAAHLLS